MKKLILLGTAFCLMPNFVNGQLLGYNWADQFSPTTAVTSGGDCVTYAGQQVFSAGRFNGTVDFNPTAGVANLTAVGSQDMYVSSLNVGNGFNWVKQVGGPGGALEIPRHMIVIGPDLYVVGTYTGATDFDLTAVGGSPAFGGEDIFIARYNGATGALVWVVNVGSPGNDQAFGVTADNAGNLVVVGYCSTGIDFDPSGGVTTMIVMGGDVDGFIVRYTTAGALVPGSLKQIGSPTVFTGNETVANVRVNAAGETYVCGTYITNLCDFDPGAGVQTRPAGGNRDGFVAKYDAAGNYVWVTVFGGGDLDAAQDLAIDGNSVYVASGFKSASITSNPAGFVHPNTAAGTFDIAVSSLNAFSGAILWSQSFGSAGDDQALSIELDGPTNIYVGGTFSNTVDFEPSFATGLVTSNGSSDFFLTRFRLTGLFRDAVSVGGTGSEILSEIHADVSGRRLYATGTFQNTADFDPSAVIVNRTAPFMAVSNAFLAQYNYSLVPLMVLNDDAEAVPTESVLVETVLGTEMATEVELKYYPNPTNGMIYLENMSEGALVEMYSMDGSLAGSWTALSTERLTLDLSELTNGIYMIQVKNTDGSVATGKVILQH